MISPYKSYAKINRFLNVLERRDDNYYNIQSLFQLINLYDTITFKKRNDGKIKIKSNLKELEKENIIYKAIALIKDSNAHKDFGLNVQLQKNIPLGSGLGGGSSNAATTLLAINDIFHLGMTKAKLMKLASHIGSDVPFFINHCNSWVEGKGDRLTKIFIDKCYFILAFTNEVVSTFEMYNSLSSHRRLIDTSYEDFLNGEIQNSFKIRVLKKYPPIKKLNNILMNFGTVHLSGSGGTLFICEKNEQKARDIFRELPRKYNFKLVHSLY